MYPNLVACLQSASEFSHVSEGGGSEHTDLAATGSINSRTTRLAGFLYCLLLAMRFRPVPPTPASARWYSALNRSPAACWHRATLKHAGSR